MTKVVLADIWAAPKDSPWNMVEGQPFSMGFNRFSLLYHQCCVSFACDTKLKVKYKSWHLVANILSFTHDNVDMYLLSPKYILIEVGWIYNFFFPSKLRTNAWWAWSAKIPFYHPKVFSVWSYCCPITYIYISNN